jgi:hypothetical protein
VTEDKNSGAHRPNTHGPEICNTTFVKEEVIDAYLKHVRIDDRSMVNKYISSVSGM